jgi:DNA-binding winged helix-turn-helix (wHTH) protein
LIFLRTGASFRHETRKAGPDPLGAWLKPHAVRFDDYLLDVARRELWRGSELVVVEPQVFDLLAYLVQHPERVVTKDELLQAVWDGRIVSESAITNRINAARRAIGESGKAQRLIRTVPRKAFALSAQSTMKPSNRQRRPCRRVPVAARASLSP